MRHTTLLLLSAILLPMTVLLSSSHAATAKEWDGMYSPSKSSYLLYSGDPGEKEAPKPGQQKLSLMMEGQLAENLFHSIGPDKKQACGASTGVRIRTRGDVTCAFDRELKSEPYTCFIGVDLKTGKSIRGETC